MYLNYYVPYYSKQMSFNNKKGDFEIELFKE